MKGSRLLGACSVSGFHLLVGPSLLWFWFWFRLSYRGLGFMGCHVPLAGGTASPSLLRVVHVSVEMAPIAKVTHKPQKQGSALGRLSYR